MPLFGTSRRVARRTARRTSRRQMAMYGNQGYDQGYDEPEYAAPAPAAPAEPDPMEQLQKLAELHTQGILTDEEFAAQKAKLLG
jgi:Short C-terminal domain